MGSRVLPVRLPDSHWIWEEENKKEIIIAALDLYRKTGGLETKLQEICLAVEEIRDMLKNGAVVVRDAEYIDANKKEQEKEPDIDPRLLDALQDFLDF